jgi:hypothetical protein
MMNWDDTIGKYIHALMVTKALEVKPSANRQKLDESIARTSLSIGLARQGCGDVLQAELEALIAMRVMGIPVTNDFLAGMLASIDLIRDGKHVLDDNDSDWNE